MKHHFLWFSMDFSYQSVHEIRKKLKIYRKFFALCLFVYLFIYLFIYLFVCLFESTHTLSLSLTHSLINSFIYGFIDLNEWKKKVKKSKALIDMKGKKVWNCYVWLKVECGWTVKMILSRIEKNKKKKFEWWSRGWVMVC